MLPIPCFARPLPLCPPNLLPYPFPPLPLCPFFVPTDPFWRLDCWCPFSFSGVQARNAFFALRSLRPLTYRFLTSVEQTGGCFPALAMEERNFLYTTDYPTLFVSSFAWSALRSFSWRVPSRACSPHARKIHHTSLGLVRLSLSRRGPFFSPLLYATPPSPFDSELFPSLPKPSAYVPLFCFASLSWFSHPFPFCPVLSVTVLLPLLFLLSFATPCLSSSS
ncbi:hypothetical protein K443DRAFT_205833 [Laccaria amethystina LaAM-08-1]|uniref:Unplaced genomic scaffold K443scaffold_130, whole genome shotgun sequence n=1 Tax=Laccaria amethystina LaAM-08-1 TaxID=1095629 RepID=A0A0C9XM67_9AGAR|nr:hypothetical protein K443DRAFT_205833 [Laccaria amethystina LaAM-08-1]